MWAFIGGAMVVAIGGGLALGVLFAVPLFVYSLPYTVWLGWHCGENGIPRKLPSASLPPVKNMLHDTKNATKLYRSWITHKPHNITDW